VTPFALAWSNLAHKRGRTAIAAGGVAFAVILIFMELGLLGGVGRTATMLYDNLNFDLLLLSSEYLDLSRTSEIPRARLAQARAATGVDDVIPLHFSVGGWRAPTTHGLFGTRRGGGVMSINVLGVPPGQVDRAFRIGPNGVFPNAEEARARGALLGRLDSVLFDRRSKPEFGDYRDLMAIRPDGTGGDEIRLNGKQAVVVGYFELGTGFSWNGMLMSSEETFNRILLGSESQVSFGLVQLKPGVDVVQVQRELRAVLPPDVQVLTRAEINAMESRYWLRVTSVGQFLLVAVVLAVVVGVIFVYQMMAADIRAMLPEYATVKALGYRPPYLTGVVLWQAVLLALIGYVPGFLAAIGLYAAARKWGGIPTGMTIGIALGVLVLTCGMCLASGLLAMRKVHTADPADLF
jgi:putative ABC transport system permease protein